MKKVFVGLLAALFLLGCAGAQIITDKPQESMSPPINDEIDISHPPSIEGWVIEPDLSPVGAPVRITCTIVPGKSNRIIDWRIFAGMNGKKVLIKTGPGAGFGENIKVVVDTTFEEAGYGGASIDFFWQNDEMPDEKYSASWNTDRLEKKK